MLSHDWDTKKAVILGCSGPSLTDDEITFYANMCPLGFILFKRNCETPKQLKALTKALRSVAKSKNVPILIDQEGGNVARLAGPHWRHPPDARTIGNIAESDLKKGCRAAYLNARLIGRELMSMGINVNCSPVLDISSQSTHRIIGTRAYSNAAHIVRYLGQSVCIGLAEEGVTPIIKHIPGHGRATTDSHVELPIVGEKKEVLKDTDFLPFEKQNSSTWAMTAHILYKHLDSINPATQSKVIISKIIRDEISFDGIVISDDIGMNALKGDFSERASKSLEAGCDIVMHCSGKIEEMKTFVRKIPRLSDISRIRLSRTQSWISKVRSEAPKISETAINRELDKLLENSMPS